MTNQASAAAPPPDREERTPAVDATQPEISFFVPCYNEERNIGGTLATIAEAIGTLPHEVLVIDDGSKDGTGDVVRSYMAAHPERPIRFIIRGKNQGLGLNYFKAAFEARGRYYMLVNGDNVEPVETIRAITALVGKADMVVPNFGRGDKRPWSRRAISATFTFITNLLSGNRIGYYNGPVLHLTENVRFWRSETIGYGYQAELLCKMLANGATYVEVVVPNGDREWGSSKAFAPGNFLSVANSLFHILLRRITRMTH
ncbi:glycosyltransferase family 2 protein [Ferrovibrio sp.]|jgi:dolichol-phosphate mannosyltransferase|uniref:glycosyltransferase family 2 protein n=1 Tax=Ferrovibrio sp. TaxID=1917215 RepID=UPI003D281A3E